ncbi:hypothetical protein CLV58_109136 [Spirosoma oryzae]|uniref:Uncharacterized protein n=1 Tax=Spirosoma oryzae TaxID=1469603 RepID=A0A2T0SYE6_9BACT|nr:hypothetical protein [Spirosoma oryzae]PRY38409.1 hypothetical protein CLV58_109136 [Spirosoma oryzae]
MELNYHLMESHLGKQFGTGWGNGYVELPEGHPWFNVHYEHIPVDIHGGLTYANFEEGKGWVIGFDTAHYGDSPDNWSEEAVLANWKTELDEERLKRDQLEESGNIERYLFRVGVIYQLQESINTLEQLLL